MASHHVVPAGGRITAGEGGLIVPPRPIIPFIEGDGVGPDVTRAMRRVLDAAVEKAFDGKRKLAWMELYAGEKAEKLRHTNLPDETVEALKAHLVAIKGPLTTPVGGGFRSLNVTLRQVLDLYACVRPVRHYRGVPSPMREPEKLNIVIFRENTEDVYAGLEWAADSAEAKKLRQFLEVQLGAKLREDAGLGLKPMSRFGSQRLVRAAITYALAHGRRSVTLVHKGNIMKHTEGAFRDWGYEVGKTFKEVVPESELEHYQDAKVADDQLVLNDRIADSMFQQLLLRPDEYSVLATPNLNGDYLSDAAAAQVGGLGIAPGANINYETGHAVFEATHGSAPKYAGQDKVNPGSLILSGVMMLEYLGWNEAAKLVEDAFEKTIAKKIVPYDFARQIKGAKEVKCSEFAEAVVKAMK